MRSEGRRTEAEVETSCGDVAFEDTGREVSARCYGRLNKEATHRGCSTCGKITLCSASALVCRDSEKRRSHG